jgi:hypothetical protein
MGRKLIEHTFPEIAKQLERIADALDRAYQIKEEKQRAETSKKKTDTGPF